MPAQLEFLFFRGARLCPGDLWCCYGTISGRNPSPPKPILTSSTSSIDYRPTYIGKNTYPEPTAFDPYPYPYPQVTPSVEDPKPYEFGHDPEIAHPL